MKPPCPTHHSLVITALCATFLGCPLPQDGFASEPLTGDNVVSISTADGRGADAFVRNGEPASENFGSEPGMAMKSFPAGIKKAYVRFDIEPLKGKKITDAELVFTTFNNHSMNETVNVFGLVNGHEGALWEEGTGGEVQDPTSGINYLNAPANEPGPGGESGVDTDTGLDPSAAVYLGSFNVSREDPVLRQGEEIRFKDQMLTNHLNSLADGVATFILTASSRKNMEDVGFATKENPKFSGPELRVLLE